jgi:hypothetical protein
LEFRKTKHIGESRISQNIPDIISAFAPAFAYMKDMLRYNIQTLPNLVSDLAEGHYKKY